MGKYDAIVNPGRGIKSPDPGGLAVIVSSDSDLGPLCERMNVKNPPVNIMMSKIYGEDASPTGFSISGPVTGAPYGVILMETLAAWGAKEFLYFGWCGSISREVETGDILIPKCAVIDEGTSQGYGKNHGETVYPPGDVNEKIKNILKSRSISFHEGNLWTTDAIFRETREKVESFQNKNVLAVEMELSALFTVGHFRNVKVGAVLVVSDELASFTWKPGFKDKRFKQSRRALIEVIEEYASRFSSNGH